MTRTDIELTRLAVEAGASPRQQAAARKARAAAAKRRAKVEQAKAAAGTRRLLKRDAVARVFLGADLLGS